MKKFSLVLILFASLSFCFAQNFNESKKIQSGDITILDTYIFDLALAKMNNQELRILRNMIFAKYGHSFKSEDLKTFFSQFDWYTPGKSVSESAFTKQEKNLLERIKSFETRNENGVSLKFGNEIIGLWHQSPAMPDTWCDRFLIYPENRIEFLVSFFDEDAEVREYLGTYEIKGNVLIFTVNKIVKNQKTLTLDTPLIFKFPVTKVSEMSFGDGALVRQMIKIGGYEYFLYSDNTETMGDWSRRA